MTLTEWLMLALFVATSGLLGATLWVVIQLRGALEDAATALHVVASSIHATKTELERVIGNALGPLTSGLFGALKAQPPAAPPDWPADDPLTGANAADRPERHVD